ncbi:MAG TPA: TonB-dependent receptor [Steroidobacteraceae bacterium]|jgi:outer membrane receptor protein involved in Fe transport
MSTVGYRRQRDLAATISLLLLVATAHGQEQTTAQRNAQGTPCVNGVTPEGQPCTEKVQEVVITGSRIARPDLDRLQPTTVVGAETFDQRGYTDVGQALSELPAFGVQPTSAVNTQNINGIGQSFVDLYSLGSQRTLVLVNGRRFVSSNSASFAGAGSAVQPGQQVDLNVIPTKLIDRIETVSVGGAPIYGADAIAGTVNIIMKKNYEGLDMDAMAGVSDDKDAWNYRARVLAGTNFADDRGNFTGVAEFSKSDGLVGNSRKNFSANESFEAPFTPGPFTSVLTPDSSVAEVSTSGVPYLDNGFYLPGVPPNSIGFVNGQGQPLAFSPGSSQLSPYNLGTPTGNPVFWSGGDGIRLGQFSNLLSPIERINIDGMENFKLTDHINLFGESWFSETHGTNIIAQPAYNTTIFGFPAGTVNGTFKVPVNSPFLSPGDRALIASQLAAYGAATTPATRADPNWSPDFFYLSRANTDLESGAAVGDQVLLRQVVGANGDFQIGDSRNYTWEIAASYGYSRNNSTQPAYVFQNVQNALNAMVNAQGQIVCAPNQPNAPYKTLSSQCAPLNLFGQGSPSKEAVAYITHMAQASSIDTQRDATANLSGDIIKLPAGEWKAAIGFENRREAAKFTADSFFTTVPSPGQLNATDVNGAYHTNEAYVETLVPIFEPDQDIPFLHQVELEGAIRRVDNSIAGSSNTWTAGARWAPVQDVLFRGNRTVSIRAPAITELFLPSSRSTEFANDPCDKTFVGQGSVPGLRKANCQSQGIDTSTFVSNVVNATATGVTSGNPNLASETADAKTWGVVLRPRWVPRLNLSADYLDIKMSNAIEQLNLVELMDECYDAPDFPNNTACSHFTRSPTTHQVTSYVDGFINAGLLHFQGITASADYSFDLPASFGSIQLRANYLDTRILLLQVGSAAPINEAGQLGTDIGTPKSRGSMDLSWTKGPFQWYWQGQYISGMNFNNQNTPTSQNILRVNPWWIFNSTITYNVTGSLQTRLIVDNVFDKEPPFPALAAGTGGNFASATSLYFPGIIGRTYQLEVDYRF